MRALRSLIAVVAAFGLSGSGDAADAQERPLRSVAPTGNDAGPGTPVAPWRTLQKAATSAPPGALVDIRGGTYAGRVRIAVSGRPGAPITFRARPGERVVVSGRGLRAPRGERVGLIEIDGRAYVELEGLVVRDFVARRPTFTPVGVHVTGASHHVTLRRLDVSRIRALRVTPEDGNAHGIAVYGTTRTPITDVAIEGSRVHRLKLGASEAVAVNGNVAGFRITGNRVERVDNIGIDAIGYEGTAPINDRARDGVVADNVVSDVDTKLNRAYDEEDGGNCRCAGGIYVDGGQRILIERNRVTRANLGIELASEARRGATSDVLMRNNLIMSSTKSGLTMGGYDTRRGRTERALVVNNTLVGNDTARSGSGEIELNYRLSATLLYNNVIVAGRRGILVTNPFRQNRGARIDGNVWSIRGGAARWAWRTRQLRDFAAWQRATGGDRAGRFVPDPLAPGGRPRPGAPPIDAGVATPLAGDTDLTGAPRLVGDALDAGAFEAG